MKLVLEDQQRGQVHPPKYTQPPRNQSDAPPPSEVRQLRTRGVDSQLEEWRSELDEYHSEMVDFQSCEPSEIFRKLAAWSARASYVRGQIMRVENRALTTFRTKELDPFINTLDFQFKVWSRYTSALHQEIEITTKGY